MHRSHRRARSRLNAASLLRAPACSRRCCPFLQAPDDAAVPRAGSNSHFSSKGALRAALAQHVRVTPLPLETFISALPKQGGSAAAAREPLRAASAAPRPHQDRTGAAGTHPAGDQTPAAEEQRILQSTHQSCCPQPKGTIKKKSCLKAERDIRGLGLSLSDNIYVKESSPELVVFFFFLSNLGL